MNLRALALASLALTAGCTSSSSDTTTTTTGSTGFSSGTTRGSGGTGATSGATSGGGSTSAGTTTSAGTGGGGWQAFAGTWAVSGNGTLTYDGGSETASGSADAPSYQVSFAHGSTSDLVSLDSAGCQLNWSVSGGTATLELPQTCTTSSGLSGYAWTVSSGSLTLTVLDSNHLSGSGNLEGVIDDAPYSTVTSTAQGVGTLTRINP